jgi:mannose-1-phosphate guanylyltransferase
MVLCAGYGTRMRPLTDERPKPLLPFGDRTLLEHVLDGLPPALLPAVVNAHHLPDVFIELTKRWRAIAEVLVESEILGTAGGVAGAGGRLGPAPVVVTNGDVLARVDFAALLAHTPPEGVCLAVAPCDLGTGTVGLGARGEVVRLRGERFGNEVASGDYVGTLGLGDGALEALPARGCLIGDLTLPLLRRGLSVTTVPVRGHWFAPGDGLAAYLDEHRAWLAERAAGMTHVSAAVAPPSYVAAGARVASGVELVASVIGADASVSGTGVLEGVVVWPGAEVCAPLSDAVVTARGNMVRRTSR